MPESRAMGIRQSRLEFGSPTKLVLPGWRPYFSTNLGDAYLADSLELMKSLPDDSVNVVLTSPPYALHFQKEYGNATKSDYVAWFVRFAREFHRILKPGIVCSQYRRQL